MSKPTTYDQHIINSYHMEQRKQQKLNPPKFGEKLQRNWQNDLYMNQVIYQRNGMDRASIAERVICVLAIVAIIGLCYYYSPLFDGLFREVVK